MRNENAPVIRVTNSGVDSLSPAPVQGVDETEENGSNSGVRVRPKTDSVILSNASSLVSLAKSGDASRAPKLQAIRADLQAGRYQTHDSEVSQAMVRNHLAG